MNSISIEEKLPYFMGTYNIGHSLKLKLILLSQEPGIDDDVLIELLIDSDEALLTFPILSADLFLNAIHEFEIDRLTFLMDKDRSSSKAIKE